MFCNKCGKELNENTTFCMECGTKVGQAEQQAVQPVQQVQQVQPVQHAQPVVRSGTQHGTQHGTQPGTKHGTQHMTVMGWIGTFLLLLIPLVNIILVFVWAFGSETNRSKKTFFQAYLVMMVVMIGVSIAFGSAIAIFVRSMIENGAIYY